MHFGSVFVRLPKARIAKTFGQYVRWERKHLGVFQRRSPTRICSIVQGKFYFWSTPIFEISNRLGGMGGIGGIPPTLLGGSDLATRIIFEKKYRSISQNIVLGDRPTDFFGTNRFLRPSGTSFLSRRNRRNRRNSAQSADLQF